MITDRLNAIARCMNELEEIRIHSREVLRLIAVVGEMDWLTELHRLLYCEE